MRGPRERDGAGRTPLTYAAASGDADVAAGLIAMRGDVGVRTTKKDARHFLVGAGMMPLHFAALFSTRTEVLDVLLDARARVDARDDNGGDGVLALRQARRNAGACKLYGILPFTK